MGEGNRGLLEDILHVYKEHNQQVKPVLFSGLVDR